MNHLYCKNLSPSLQIINFGKTMQRILEEKDRIKLKDQHVTIKQFCYTRQKLR